MGVTVSSDELQSIMDDIDVDKSGYIEFNEFATLSARYRYLNKEQINIMKIVDEYKTFITKLFDAMKQPN